MSTQPDDSLLFVDAHRPAISAGTYDVTMTHEVSGAESSGAEFNETFHTTARFHVLGPRTTITPGWVAGRFPPPHSTGDHADVLPHVALSRSSLPWERTADRGGPSDAPPPWMAVLVLTDEEIAGGKGLPAATLHEVPAASLAAAADPPAPGAPAFPGLDAEPGESGTMPVRVLDLPRQHVEAYLPDGAGLASLAHVTEHVIGAVDASATALAALDEDRLTTDLVDELRLRGCPLGPQLEVGVEEPGAQWTITDRETARTVYLEHDASAGTVTAADEARAIVVSCRTTQPGQSYRAFLVSVESRYQRDASGVLSFDTGPATHREDLVRLVVLDTWTFAVDPDAGHLEHLLLGLFQDSHSGSRTRDLTLAVPTDGMSGPGVDVLRVGYALLPHELRHGGHTRSWYRGPLVPAPRPSPPAPPHSPVSHSDQLLVLDQEHCLLDTSYAAAYELGRELLLANREVALDLAAWKQAARRAGHRARRAVPHLEISAGDASETDLPEVPSSVGDFVERLVHLEGIPFAYLVADPRMLPIESARAFVVDHQWLYHLLGGVASIGRLHDRHTDHETAAWWALRDRAYRSLLAGPGPQQHPRQVSGILLRSEVVSGWPDLHVLARSAGSSSPVMPTVRRAALSYNVLLVLVDGAFGTLEVHADLQALHHGRTGSTPMRSKDVIDVSTVAAPPGTESGPLSPAEVGHTLLANGPPRVMVRFS